MKHINLLLSILFIAILANCSQSAPNKIHTNAKKGLYGKRILSATYRQPPFIGNIPKEKLHNNSIFYVFVGGAIGGALKSAEQGQYKRESGNLLIGKSKIKDPAKDIGQEIRNHLSLEHNMVIETYEDADINFIYDEDYDVLNEQFPNTDFLLITQTIDWGLNNINPRGYDNYNIYYNSSMKLLDLKNKKGISQGKCELKSRTYTLSFLSKNNGEPLKFELEKMAKQCALSLLKNNL